MFSGATVRPRMSICGRFYIMKSVQLSVILSWGVQVMTFHIVKWHKDTFSVYDSRSVALFDDLGLP